MRVVLMSYGAEGFAVLHGACREAGHDPVAYVCAAPGRPGSAAADRGRALAGGIMRSAPPGPDLLMPRGAGGLARLLTAYQPDVVVCSGFPWRLPPAALRAPRLGVLNVHPSLLPRHRGPMPVHWAVRQGDRETGVTIHWMDESFDSGPVMARRGGIPLEDDLDGDVVHRRIQDAVRELLPEALARAEDGCAGEPQNEADASYEGTMGPEDAFIDRSAPAWDAHNLVRAFRYGLFPVPGPLAVLGGDWMSVLRTSTEPGDGMRMECGDGPLWVTESVPVPPREQWFRPV